VTGTPADAAPRVLVDTDVVLDLALARAPWADDAGRLLDAAHGGRIHALLAGHAVTTIHYVVERSAGRTSAAVAVSDVLRLLEVVPLDGSDFQRALALGLTDYEDAVQVAAYLRAGAHLLATRNGRDFRSAPVAARTPGEVLALLAATGR
jgi:predicted nucleic acid-binding protein